jgi:pimeloyl-ACP methyl ester carboxylesterase
LNRSSIRSMMAPAGEAAARMLQLEVRGYTFDAAAAGDPRAPLVLLLHGFPQTRHSYRDQLPALAERGFHAVAPDQRGYSPGARPSELASYRMEELVADVLGFADALGAERFDLVGHDWGGQVSWLVAAHHPARVRSLTVLSRPHPAAFVAALRADDGQAERSRHHRAFDDEGMADRLLEDGARRLRRMLSGQGVATADVDAYVSALGTHAALDAALRWYRAAPESAAELRGHAVPAIQAPTLYVWGEQDATVGRAAAERSAQHVRGAYRFATVPGAGHFLTDQASERVTSELLAHLATRP